MRVANPFKYVLSMGLPQDKRPEQASNNSNGHGFTFAYIDTIDYVTISMIFIMTCL